MKRMARYLELPQVMPDSFPVRSLASSPAFSWLVDDDATLAKRLAKHILTILGVRSET